MKRPPSGHSKARIMHMEAVYQAETGWRRSLLDDALYCGRLALRSIRQLMDVPAAPSVPADVMQPASRQEDTLDQAA